MRRVFITVQYGLIVAAGLPPQSAPAQTTDTRLRWTVSSAGDLFVIDNHNLQDVADRWQLDSNQRLVTFQYAFRS